MIRITSMSRNVTVVPATSTFDWMKTPETVAILGASPKPDRYAYKAFELLQEYGHRPVPINPAFADILGEKCYPTISDAPRPIDTVTLYLGEARSNPLIDDIVAAKPRRIIMNPGAENFALAEKAEAAGIEVVEGCTLVMLRTGSF
jgi:predicted CoA-binding protein